jgi:PAS domain S-box-containing protein
MKDDSKTKKQLIDELTELKKSITGSISAQLAVDESRRYAESIVETVREPLLVLDSDLKILSANRNFYKTFRVTPLETIQSFIYDLGNKQWDIPKLRELLEEILPEKEAFDDFEVAHHFQDIGHKIMLLNARQIYRKDIGTKMILLAIEDITNRKQLEELLTESEERYRRLFETANDGIVLLEKREGKITHANPATEKMLGYTIKDSIGNSLQDIGILLDVGDFQATMQNLNKIGILNYDDVPVITKSGQHIDTDIYLVDRARLVQCNIRDITERKRAEEALREESEELFRIYLEYAPDAVYTSDLEGNFLYGNLKCEELIGYRREELIGKNFFKLNILTEKSLNKAAKLLQANIEGKSTGPDEIELINKEGRIIPVGISTSVVQRMGQRIVLAFVRDISDRKLAEEKLRLSEEKYRWILDNMADVITVMDMTLRFTYVSPSILRMRGYTPEEALAQTFEQIMTPGSLQISAKVFEEEMKLEADGTANPDRIRIVEVEQYTKDGSIVLMENHLSFMRDEAKKPVGIISVSHDITERKKAEERLYRANAFLDSIVENIPIMLFLKDAQELKFIRFNRAGEELLGYSSEDLLGKSDYDFFPKENAAFFAEKDREVLRGREVVDIPEESIQTRTRGERVLHTKKVPIMNERGEPEYLLGISEDITERKRAEEELQRTLENLRKAFVASIQLLVSAVESRDPYTAGHQIRSTNLARAIATEMGLPREKIEGLRMAGSIHDIGKLSIPAEILSKPTKLTNIEFSLIKEHARAGYEMLKDVESPWPLAEIVHQHHERMDGSGYPGNLKGDEILMEARILAVADVVESMASHRPYRPAIGIQAALEEIEKNKGILYDDAVADACLRLFREKGFQL